MDFFIPKVNQSVQRPFEHHSHYSRPHISHTHIYSENYGITGKSVKNVLSEVNTGSPLYKIHTTMDGDNHAVYHVNFIKLLDKVFLFDDLEKISVEQERFISVFFKQADDVTKILDNNAKLDKDDDPFQNMDIIMRELDNFLGSYFGVDYDRFAQ